MLQTSPLQKAVPRQGKIGTETWHPDGVRLVSGGWQILGAAGISQGLEWPDIGYGLFRLIVQSFCPYAVDPNQLFGFWMGGPAEGLDIEFRPKGHDPNQPGIWLDAWQNGQVSEEVGINYVPIGQMWRITIDYQPDSIYGSVEFMGGNGKWLNVLNHRFSGVFVPGMTLRCGAIYPNDSKPYYSRPLVSGFLVSVLELNPTS